MGITSQYLTSSFTSLSFSTHLSQPPNPSFLPISLSPKLRLVVAASSSAPAELELRKYVKSRLPDLAWDSEEECAIARVVLQEGSGKIIINYRDVQEYLQGNPLWVQYVKTPLVTLGYENSYDVFVKAEGGGLSGQAQAISLGIARALLKVSDSHRSPLKQEGLLTRDARVVERKKVGLKKARKRPQFSKRWVPEVGFNCGQADNFIERTPRGE
ncbi:hypothetical protein Leryth_005330 [Lithospermum erythrorhizon]|nr:hypothetical protein Leryth_005330 [Lithospermum erythrorhizon]